MVKLVDLSKNIRPSRQCSRCKGTFIRELLTITSLNEMLCNSCLSKRQKYIEKSAKRSGNEM